jgi:hypothetical protein
VSAAISNAAAINSAIRPYPCDVITALSMGPVRSFPPGRGPILEMVRGHYGDLSPTLILGNLFRLVANTIDRRGLVIWSGLLRRFRHPARYRAPNRHLEQAIKSHFEQSARAVALTVCPHTQVQLSLSSFTPMFCNVPLPEVMVHCPDTTCSELSLQCASQMVF